ncbi:hypothetical protein VPNG_04460 [Cytospora leucostoma]|uniref:SP-RING-type domain-containing protein n=1 Tax=Cytospora leucostoma TaxID=1230097 RepID=A0A423XBX9_9PEZI|nr:hypothetical protein VPNG_04460 [Cytospora leucostoma]
MSSTFSQRRRAEGPSRPAARRPQQSRRGEEDALDLPAYEPPKCPLTGPAQRALRDLASSRISEKYREGLASSASLLSNSVYVINERLTNRKRAAAQVAEKVAKRKTTGDGGDADAGAGAAAVEKAEGAARELEDEVSALSTQVEEAMRQVLDMQAALQDEKGILGDLPGAVETKQQAVAGQALQEQEEDDDVEDQDPPEIPGVPILDVLQEERDAKAAEYEKLRPYEKYALNNSYIEFKKSWHQGLYPDEEVPLPDATKWFDQDGRPRHGTREDGRRRGGDDGEEDSDDDIQIAREKRSFKCPLSLGTMKEPYTCRLCKHSFDRSSIFEYIKGPNGRGTTAKCPIPGCQVDAMTIKDLYLDEALLRRMKRAAQAEREEQDRSSGPEEEEEEEEDNPPSAAVRSDIKAEAEAEDDD